MLYIEELPRSRELARSDDLDVLTAAVVRAIGSDKRLTYCDIAHGGSRDGTDHGDARETGHLYFTEAREGANLVTAYVPTPENTVKFLLAKLAPERRLHFRTPQPPGGRMGWAVSAIEFDGQKAVLVSGVWLTEMVPA